MPNFIFNKWGPSTLRQGPPKSTFDTWHYSDCYYKKVCKKSNSFHFHRYFVCFIIRPADPMLGSLVARFLRHIQRTSSVCKLGVAQICIHDWVFSSQHVHVKYRTWERNADLTEAGGELRVAQTFSVGVHTKSFVQCHFIKTESSLKSFYVNRQWSLWARELCVVRRKQREKCQSFLCDEIVTEVSLRSGGFAFGWAHHAVLVNCQHHVHQDQSAGATTLPCPTLFCHAAWNSFRADPVGGRCHAPLWPLQTLAAEGGCAAGSEGRGLSAL